MSLRAALDDQAGAPRRAACTVSLLLDELSADDRAALIAAMDDVRLSGAAIARALATIGHQMRSHNIQRHRRKECSCDSR